MKLILEATEAAICQQAGSCQSQQALLLPGPPSHTSGSSPEACAGSIPARGLGWQHHGLALRTPISSTDTH